jgi:mRNA interferase MazF
MVEAGLPAPSIVRPVKIATIEEKDTEAAGRLPLADRKAVARCLSAALRDAGAAD